MALERFFNAFSVLILILIISCFTLLQAPLRGFLGNVPSDYHSYALITMVLLSTFLILMAKWASRRRPTMTRKRKKLLLDQQEFVTNVVKAKKVSAWKRKAALPLESAPSSAQRISPWAASCTKESNPFRNRIWIMMYFSIFFTGKQNLSQMSSKQKK